VQYGVSVPPFGPFGDAAELAALARDAEAVGWDGFFIWDHVVYDPTFHPIVDPWVGLAAVALSTTRMRIGTMVTPLARRRPWKLARETVSVDRLSGGRLILGVGLGDPAQWDYGFFGEETDARQRAGRLDEGLEVLTGLWSGEPFSFRGQHYDLAEVTFRPRPAQQPRIPVWVGGWWPNKPPLRRAARWDGMCPAKWGAPLTPDELAAAMAYVDQHRTATTPFDVVVGGGTDGEDLAGSAALMAEYAEVGATWWIEDGGPWRYGANPEDPWRDADTEAVRRRIGQGPPRPA
jgi:alkanesulfonate monooxygenase SsuD/methylene tetrahydromethanopterin reductase-like flavin-dependent oxidoreductase (luciferase family)